MRVLVGITAYGSAKNYVLDKFLEMKEHCMDGIEGLSFAWATHIPSEEASSVFPGDVWVQLPPGLVFVEDIIMPARDMFRRMAIENGFDKVLYQGLDCLWQSRADFTSVMERDVDVVSALTSARSDSSYAVARRFESRHHEAGRIPPNTWGEKQYDIPDEDLMAGDLVPSGFPGADAIFFSRQTMYMDWYDHTPWYRRVEQGRPNLDCMEYVCLKLMNEGYRCYVDSGIRVWHVHEDRIARMWKGVERPLDELAW